MPFYTHHTVAPSEVTLTRNERDSPKKFLYINRPIRWGHILLYLYLLRQPNYFYSLHQCRTSFQSPQGKSRTRTCPWGLPTRPSPSGPSVARPPWRGRTRTRAWSRGPQRRAGLTARQPPFTAPHIWSMGLGRESHFLLKTDSICYPNILDTP